MVQRDSSSRTSGAKLHPPTNDEQLAWAMQMLPQVEERIVAPALSQQHRKNIYSVLGRFMGIYFSSAVNLSDENVEAISLQRRIQVEDMTVDVEEYPLWAIDAAIRVYRKTERFPPKVSADLLPLIVEQMHQWKNIKRLCNRILCAINVDELQRKIDAITDEQLKAEACLDAANQVDSACHSVASDPIAGAFYRQWQAAWTNWRSDNARIFDEDSGPASEAAAED